MGEPASVPTNVQMIMAVNRYRLTQIIHCVAKFGIADLLVSGPKGPDELATSCGVHAGALFRLLRAAAGVGIFRQDDEGRFENTPLSETLRADARPSLRAYALMLGEDWHWRIWEDLLNTVRSGTPAFPRLFGSDVREYQARNPEVSATFRGAMESILILDAIAVLSLYDFSAYRTVLYLGFAGGYVGFLTQFFGKYPDTQVVLLELPENEVVARADLAREGLLERCRIIAAEPLAALPQGGDIHLLRHILVDYGDEEALRLLRNCHRALPADGRLLIAGMIVPPPNEAGLAKIIDFEGMLMTAGGKERTEAEYRKLARAAGFQVSRILGGPFPTSVIEMAKSQDV